MSDLELMALKLAAAKSLLENDMGKRQTGLRLQGAIAKVSLSPPAMQANRKKKEIVETVLC
ncbi:MAG UNVERIFIED_CONTAM: hypothetical protein LVT10_07020 [Anaerolineae bacterium]